MKTETLTVDRGETDKFGQRTTASTHTIQGVMSWAGFTTVHDRSESAKTRTELYVARGTNVEARDRLTRSNGETFAVVGNPAWDQLHPISGYDFGWSVFQLQSMNG